jgi:hypothetical protein
VRARARAVREYRSLATITKRTERWQQWTLARDTGVSLDTEALAFADKSYMTGMNSEIVMRICRFKDIHNPDTTSHRNIALH